MKVPQQSGQQNPAELTIAIPTYGREQVLIDTIAAVLENTPVGTPLLIVDQTVQHEASVSEHLENYEKSGRIQRLVLVPPSIPRAMNLALQKATTPYVLFFDDDIVPEPGIVEAHLKAHQRENVAIVAGRVIQPWQEGMDFSDAQEFHFATQKPRHVETFMGGNVSLDRIAVITVGGFDENFVRVAYRFENELAHRMLHFGYRTFFEPSAVIHHLKFSTGGTRSFGDRLTTLKPDHAMGEYYFIFRTWCGWSSLKKLLMRPWGAVATRHHLSKPWWIPFSLVAEGWGLVWAFWLHVGGPRYIKSSQLPGQSAD